MAVLSQGYNCQYQLERKPTKAYNQYYHRNYKIRLNKQAERESENTKPLCNILGFKCIWIK
jgi:hypothetical protein